MTTSSLTIGLDLVDCARVGQMLEEDVSALSLAFTPREVSECQADPVRLATRWAAKEATMKALGAGIGKIAPQHIEVRTDERGAPTLHLSESARTRAEDLGVTDWTLALSHDGGLAVAFVMMMRGEHGVGERAGSSRVPYP